MELQERPELGEHQVLQVHLVLTDLRDQRVFQETQGQMVVQELPVQMVQVDLQVLPELGEHQVLPVYQDLRVTWYMEGSVRL
jgi:hypothetical protein